MAVQTLLPGYCSFRSGVIRRLATSVVPIPLTAAAPALSVPRIARDIRVKIASTRAEWTAAFQLVADNYQARGYDPDGEYHFTAHHALPDTATFVAKEGECVVAVMSLVADNQLLGLPSESIYAAEIKDLRRQGRRLGEVTSLAAAGLGLREFTPVFHELIRLMKQYHVRQGGDTWVISVNPRHRSYYSKLLGYTPLGPRRAFPKVLGAPAEAYYLDARLMQAKAPDMYRQIFGMQLSQTILTPPRIPTDLIRYFASHSSQTRVEICEEIVRYVASYGSPRRW